MKLWDGMSRTGKNLKTMKRKKKRKPRKVVKKKVKKERSKRKTIITPQEKFEKEIKSQFLRNFHEINYRRIGAQLDVRSLSVRQRTVSPDDLCITAQVLADKIYICLVEYLINIGKCDVLYGRERVKFKRENYDDNWMFMSKVANIQLNKIAEEKTRIGIRTILEGTAKAQNIKAVFNEVYNTVFYLIFKKKKGGSKKNAIREFEKRKAVESEIIEKLRDD